MASVIHQMTSSAYQAEHAFFNQLSAKISEETGYEDCAYGIQMPLPVSAPKFLMFHNCSAAAEHTEQESYDADINQLLHVGLTTTEPLSLEKLIAETQSRFLKTLPISRQHGWMHVSRYINGAIGLFITSSADNKTPEKKTRTRNKIAWLSQVCHAEMVKYLMRRHMPETMAKITQREKEVLRWTADGKTTSEIAQILTLTQPTVNFHLKNATLKLASTNKTQAAIKAVTLGMLL